MHSLVSSAPIPPYEYFSAHQNRNASTAERSSEVFNLGPLFRLSTLPHSTLFGSAHQLSAFCPLAVHKDNSLTLSEDYPGACALSCSAWTSPKKLPSAGVVRSHVNHRSQIEHYLTLLRSLESIARSSDPKTLFTKLGEILVRRYRASHGQKSLLLAFQWQLLQGRIREYW